MQNPRARPFLVSINKRDGHMTSFTGFIPAGRAYLERFTSRFWSKAVAALLLVLLADHLFLGPQGLTAGSTTGIFALALVLFVAPQGRPAGPDRLYPRRGCPWPVRSPVRQPRQLGRQPAVDNARPPRPAPDLRQDRRCPRHRGEARLLH